MVISPQKKVGFTTKDSQTSTSLQYRVIKQGKSLKKIKPHDLPFFGDDCTMGVENELQAVVRGSSEDVDLCHTIFNSTYYKNLSKRINTDYSSPELINEIDALYKDKDKNFVFENSFVRFPISKLSPFARSVFHSDLRFDRNDPDSKLRSDSNNFIIIKNSQKFLRIPISYLLKLAVADAISVNSDLHPKIKVTGERIMRSFLNDNTSPELTSFFESPMKTGINGGKGVVRETLLRFFLTQLLVEYSNKKFGLEENGQKAMIYFASHTPTRQKKLNDLIPDNFYRELFMSPCLSGWRFGEEKYRYMALCHEVLSRSQLNAVKKLKDSQIIKSNLIILPNTSNTCLANNGTHINTGSIKLSKYVKENGPKTRQYNEKYVGDLVSKIFEHFVPLFINTYSCAPYRMDFTEFHPERALSFLPHELDYTHLRMLWRNWKKKAKNTIISHNMTPFGPVWLDKVIKNTFRFKGDFIPDIRLIDYFVAIMSTQTNPAFNGEDKNQEKLLEDLARSGVFDSKMSLYLLFKTRHYSQAGFSGYEGRYYSTFENFGEDMRFAGLLQATIITLCYKYILLDKVTHEDIPDTVFVESERRQAVFAAATGVESFYVKNNTKNRFLKKILKNIKKIKTSRKYKGFHIIDIHDYKKALIKTIQKDAKDIISEQGFGYVIKDLVSRIDIPSKYSSLGKMTHAVLSEKKVKSPFDLKSEAFNSIAEKYYRNDLRKKHLKEAYDQVKEDFNKLDLWASFRDIDSKNAVETITKGEDLSLYLEKRKSELFNENLDENELAKLIQLMIILLNKDVKSFS